VVSEQGPFAEFSVGRPGWGRSDRCLPRPHHRQGARPPAPHLRRLRAREPRAALRLRSTHNISEALEW